MNILRIFVLLVVMAIIPACTTPESQIPAESAGGTSTGDNAAKSPEARGTRADVSR